MRGLKYKDTVAAYGSKLFASLSEGNLKLADKLYKECEVEYRKWWPKKVWAIEDQEALLAEQTRLLSLLATNAITNYERSKLEIVRSGLAAIEELKIKTVTDFQLTHVSLVAGPSGGAEFVAAGHGKFDDYIDDFPFVG
jgi:hypothetical protein